MITFIIGIIMNENNKSHDENNTSSYEIMPDELFHWLHTSKEKINLIDIRESYEREQDHMGGQLIPLSQFQIESFNYPKEDFIVIYCQSGGRSLKVTKLLRTYGYQNIYSLKGGIMVWREKIGLSSAER